MSLNTVDIDGIVRVIYVSGQHIEHWKLSLDRGELIPKSGNVGYIFPKRSIIPTTVVDSKNNGVNRLPFDIIIKKILIQKGFTEEIGKNGGNIRRKGGPSE